MTEHNVSNISKVSRIAAYALVIVLLAACVYKHNNKYEKKLDKEQNQKIDSLNMTDRAIVATRYEIDSVHRVLPGMILDSMMRNAVCSYLMQNMVRTDSLRHVNDSLLTRAFEIANKRTIFSVPRRNTTLFTEYADFPGMRRIGRQYYANDKQIRKYDKINSENPYLTRAIRTHFDSVANNKISQLQRQMDSLLNIKHKQIENLMTRQK